MAAKSSALDDSLSRAGDSMHACSVFQGSEFLKESVKESLKRVKLLFQGLWRLET